MPALKREADQSRVWIDSERYQALDWGYAISAHRGQGLTADATLISGDPSAWAQLLYTLATRQREEIRFYCVEDRQEPPERADVAHPGAHDPTVAEPTWSHGMSQAFQRWEPATTSLDFERGDDPWVAGGTSRGDAASIAPDMEGNPWGRLVEGEEATPAHQDLDEEKTAEDHSDAPARDPSVAEGPRL